MQTMLLPTPHDAILVFSKLLTMPLVRIFHIANHNLTPTLEWGGTILFVADISRRLVPGIPEVSPKPTRSGRYYRVKAVFRSLKA